MWGALKLIGIENYGFQLSPEQKIRSIFLKIEENRLINVAHGKMTNSVSFWALHVDSKSCSETVFLELEDAKNILMKVKVSFRGFCVTESAPVIPWDWGAFDTQKKRLFQKKFGIRHDFIKVWWVLLICSNSINPKSRKGMRGTFQGCKRTLEQLFFTKTKKSQVCVQTVNSEEGSTRFQLEKKFFTAGKKYD